MQRLTTGLSLALASALAVGTLGAKAPTAQEKAKEEYVPTADMKTLTQQPLAGMDGKQITILDVTARPGWTGERHYHTGPVFVVVKEGAFTIEAEGKPPRTIQAGEVFEEPVGTPMVARNPDAAQPARFLVIQISDAGEALMYKAE